MYGDEMSETKIRVELEGPEEEKEALRKGGDLLRSLCRKEVDRFDEYLKRYGHEYTAGLAKFERFVVEGYLYQSIRGHIDATNPQQTAADRGPNGTP